MNSIILASGSPRRQQLLSEAGYDFEILRVEVDESFPASLEPAEVPEFLAKKKSDASVKHCKGNFLLITADTVVVVDNEILNKPESEQEAIEMLQKLSSVTHRVITGVCLHDGIKQKTFSSTTHVTFTALQADEIQYYIDNYKPFDKAGAYGIQEWIGLNCISKIEGSYFNVVGLPVHKLYQEIKNWQ